ncbi:MAG: histidine phosphatase family protein [Myxococcales bacterium]|nr:histidine phosphatase family protein [Myxococcales bacterium]
MRIWLARHGETPWNRDRRAQGWSDVALSDRGRAQARALGELLGSTRPEAIYASTLSRAWETAEAVARPHGLGVEGREDLWELNQGILEGLTIAEMLQRHEELVSAWWRDPGDQVLPDGESLRQVQERAWRVIEEIRARHEREVIVVTHNMVIRAILIRVLGLDFSRSRCLKFGIASLNRIGWNGGSSPSLELFNFLDHIEGS